MSGFSGSDTSPDATQPLQKGYRDGDSVVGFRDNLNARFPRLPPTQRAVVTTLTAAGTGANAGVKVGQAKWVFPNPYAAGVKPVITIAVESATGTAPDFKIVEATNTYVIIEVTQTVLNLTVLNINGYGAATVHLTANIPTPTVVMP
jgi:hypothetical protein